MATGGSIVDVAVDGRLFEVAYDADVNRSTGGYSNDMQANGNGTARLIKTMNTWSLEGVVVSIDDNRGDHEYLQGIADGLEEVDVQIRYPSGAVWGGKGQITDMIQHASNATTASLSFKGSGQLTQLS